MARVGFVITRVFANALARRVAALIAASLLAWIGIDNASAANCQTTAEACSQGQAYSAAAAHAASRSAAYNAAYPTPLYQACVYQAGTTYVAGAISLSEACKSGAGFLGRASFYYATGKTCDKESPYTGQGPWSTLHGDARNGSLGCRGGCDGIWNSVGDGTMTWSPTGGTCPENEKNNCAGMTGYYWNAVLNVCEPVEVECNDGQVKQGGKCVDACPAGMVMQVDGTCKNKANECPSGNIKAPSGECLPGDGQCASGEVKGKDGTCKRDSDGDGKPDDGEEDGTSDETFAGGDSCNAPPSCSGSVILCGQARIQWRIDCNTRKNRNISGGACSTMPVCTGEKCDAIEYSSLLMQWRTACAVEKISNKSSDGGDDGSQPEWTKVGGMNQNPGAGEVGSDAPALHERTFKTDDLDQSGFGGGSCIGLANVSGVGVVGSSYAQMFASPPAIWCDYIAKLRASLIVIAAAVACFIIAKGM